LIFFWGHIKKPNDFSSLERFQSTISFASRKTFDYFVDQQRAERTNDRAGGCAGTSMIVCSCNVITDHDVRSAVKTADAPRTTGEIYGCLGCSPQCGRCARTIRRIAEEALSLSPQCCGQGHRK